MERYRSGIWIGFFLFMVIIPSPAYFFLGQYIDTQNYENRNLESKPKLTLENYAIFPQEYESYYNDNIPFRNALIRLNSSIDYFLFKQSPNKNVSLGKEGWLFYCDDKDSNPIEQSLGYWSFTEDQLKRIANNLTEVKNYLNNLGIEFILFIAPNKETVYMDKLPEYYKIRNSYTSTDQLIDYLKNNTTIQVVYPKEDIIKTKEDYSIDLYYKLDSHWNSAGGYIGAKCLAKELGIDMPSFDEICLQTKLSSTGDLANMLNIQIKDGDKDYDISGINSLSTTNEKWDFLTEFIYHTSGADNRKLFVYRDSYATSLAPSMATQFENSKWVYKDYFNWKQVVDYEANIFVLETVERYAKDLLNFGVGNQANNGLQGQKEDVGYTFKEDIDIPISESNEAYRNIVVNGLSYVEMADGIPAVWTNGEYSCFALNFREDYNKDFRLILDILTTVNGSQQSITVYANGVEIKDVIVSSDKIYIDVPNNCIINRNLVIEVYYPNAYIPAEKGESTDIRKLAFLIKGITCQEYKIE